MYAGLLMSYGDQIEHADVSMLSLRLLKQVFQECQNLYNSVVEFNHFSNYTREHLKILLARAEEIRYWDLPTSVSGHAELFSYCHNLKQIWTTNPDCLLAIVSDFKKTVVSFNCSLYFNQFHEGIISKIA